MARGRVIHRVRCRDQMEEEGAGLSAPSGFVLEGPSWEGAKKGRVSR